MRPQCGERAGSSSADLQRSWGDIVTSMEVPAVHFIAALHEQTLHHPSVRRCVILLLVRSHWPFFLRSFSTACCTSSFFCFCNFNGVVQVAGYLGNAVIVDKEVYTLANICKDAAILHGDGNKLSCKVFRLSREYQHAACRHLMAMMPLTALLAQLPPVLHQPVMHAMLQPDADSNAAHS